ncbi:MAG: EamA family transporter RarD [Anaerovoracaceae bacterium]|nr:EamA family transporter RarD [Anaerovoracaceae bacterium]
MMNSSYKKGLIYAIACSVLWGVLPIYWQSLRPIESSVIIFYRIFLVGLVCFLASLKLYGMDEIKKHLKPKGAKLKYFLAGLLITANWSIYIWAVNADQVIQTCVGYYIEPLMVSIFGIIFFKEKLTAYKLTALVLAMAGVVVLLVHFMEVPLIALSLALTFATYAAIKKSYNLPSVLSLFYETMYIMLPALGVIIYLEVTGQGALGAGEPYQYGLLMLCGPLTAVALAFFAEAAGKVPLVTLGIIEYISPSISLLIGIFLLKEPFDMVQFIAFVIVWIGLIFFTMGEARENRGKGGKNMPEINDAVLFDVFGEEFDRFSFPIDAHRVTSGNGGEAILVFGSEKTLLYDCGMAYCGNYTVENIKEKLSEKKRNSLDYIILSHSHYDHMGALPYIKKAFPDAVVCGSEKAAQIFQKTNARKLMKELGTSARDLFMPDSDEEILVDGIAVDKVLKDGDKISLGDMSVTAMETKGHTDCSMSYIFEPPRLLFASESTGLLEGNNYVHTPFLKDCSDAIKSREKCMAYAPDYICLPHFGMLPVDFNEKYWEMLKNETEAKMKFIRQMKDEGLDEEAMLDRYVDRYWLQELEEIQPKDAFMINSRALIKAFLKAV